MTPLPRILPLISLILLGCDQAKEKANPAAAPQPSVDSSSEALAKEEEIAATAAKIEELERRIENSTNLISDMEAFVLMERAKLEDDPDYNRSFMEEALADQEEQRELIKRAREELEALK